MPSRSQRHLREFQGIDSSGSAGGAGAVALAITAPTAGAVVNPVTLAATATNDEGANVSNFVSWSSDVDGALGRNGAVTLSVGAHVLTASLDGATDTVAVTAS